MKKNLSRIGQVIGVVVGGYLFMSGYPTEVAAAPVAPRQLIAATNEARLSVGLPPYSDSLELTLGALRKGLAMYYSGVLAHVTPDGQAPWDVVVGTGYQFRTVGENLAFAHTDTDTLIEAMLNSPEHRANLLSHDHRDIGIAVVPHPTQTGESVVVMLFASPAR